MSHADHEWAKEQIPARLAGGLSADERARFEAHVALCAECIAELDAARRFERGVDALFAPVRPAPGFEERVLRALRSAPARRPVPFLARGLAAAAAALLLGIVGFAVMSFEASDRVSKSAPLASVDKDWGGYVALPTEGAVPSGPMTRGERADFQTDRLETADDDANLKNLGADRGRYADERLAFKGKPADADKSVVAFAMEEGQSQAGKRDSYYSYRNNAPMPAAGPAAPAAPEPPKPMPVAKAEPKPDPARPAPEMRRLQDAAAKQSQQQQAQPEEPKVQRRIIRSGEMEFEIDAFDPAVERIGTIAAEENGFIATVNSEKLPNGKVRGTVVVRCPPDHLDRLLQKLRALGDLKSSRIGSQDITKQYTDLESRLRAARTMEERLLRIIKEGKGEIKDLLLAEKELGEWRTRIETIEGEIRYYGNLLALSTLTITLSEREIRAPYAIVETEKVRMGIEAEDVEKTHRAAVTAVTEAKGRITQSELRHHGNGQYQATLRFEAAPEQADALRDRLKQIGVVARLDVERGQQVEGGTGRATEAKIRRADVQFDLSIYNLLQVNPRETITLNLAAAEAEAVYKAILARVQQAGGNVLSSNLNRQKSDQTTGLVQFDAKAADSDAILADLRALGEVMVLQVQENPDPSATRSKRRFTCQVFALGAVMPRETTTIQLAAGDVAAGHRILVEAAARAGGRILQAQLNESDRSKMTATVDFDVRREKEAEIAQALKAAGDVYSRSSVRAQDQENVVDSKVRITVRLFNAANIPPRETHQMTVEVRDVEKSVPALEAVAAELKGRVSGAHHTRDASGQQRSVLTVSVPLGRLRDAEARIRSIGVLRSASAQKNASVPENDLAIAQFEVTLANEVLLEAGSGPWANIKRGLSVSLTAGSWALMLIMVGVCFVLPLAAVIWIGVRVARRLRKPAAA